MNNPIQLQEMGLPFETEKQKKKLYLFLVIITEIFLFLFYCKFENPLLIIGGMLLAGTLLWMAFSVKNAIYLLFMYISLLPSASMGMRHAFWRGMHCSNKITLVLIAIIFLWVIGEVMHGKRFLKATFSKLDIAILIFLIFAVLSALKGSFENANLYIIQIELFFMLCYALYYIYTRWLDVSHLMNYWKAIIIITVAVSFEYILMAFSEGSITKILVTRIVSQQPYLAQLAIPLVGGYLLFPCKRRYKYLSLSTIIPIVAMIILSQWRGLWVGVLFSMIVLEGFAVFKEKISIIKIIKFVFVFLSVLVVLIAILLLLDKLFSGSMLLTFLSRISSFMELSSDPSLHLRARSISRALNQWNSNVVNLFFGTGLGASYNRSAVFDTYQYLVDNTYIFILWKMGIIGLISYLSIVFLFFKRGLYIFTHAEREQYRQISASLMAGFAGLLVAGLTSSCLIRYRFIIIWALMIATVEVLYLKVKKR